MKIGELGRVANTQVETIRFYEREGLLPKIGRTENNYRIYGDLHVERLMFIRHCRTLDMTLDEIRQLLLLKDAPKASCDKVNAILDDHIDHIADRIRNLRKLERQLKSLRHHCNEEPNVTHCGILSELFHTASAGTWIKDAKVKQVEKQAQSIPITGNERAR